MRAKLPRGVGTWPAIWVLPETSVYGGWPKSGEKGNLKFPLDEPMPYDLIRRVVKALSGQYPKGTA